LPMLENEFYTTVYTTRLFRWPDDRTQHAVAATDDKADGFGNRD
jgi:hypothetical protein